MIGVPFGDGGGGGGVRGPTRVVAVVLPTPGGGSVVVSAVAVVVAVAAAAVGSVPSNRPSALSLQVSVATFLHDERVVLRACFTSSI